MENKIIQKVLESMDKNIKVALVTLTDISGSTPADNGDIMIVWEDGKISGTIGGGRLEYQVIKDSLDALKKNENKKFSYSLMPDGDLGMKCGGTAEGFIKVFIPKNKLIMIGGGHIGENIVNLADFLGFHTIVIDDREEFSQKQSLQKADKIIISSYSDFLDKINIDNSTFIVIATKGHAGDQEALERVIRSEASYIGVIGSRNKSAYMKGELLKKGYTENDFKKVYAPIGLNISNQNPKEIAISIMAEILLVKNSKELKYMDKSKNIAL